MIIKQSETGGVLFSHSQLWVLPFLPVHQLYHHLFFLFFLFSFHVRLWIWHISLKLTFLLVFSLRYAAPLRFNRLLILG